VFLSELWVENFRAIRGGTINFDDGTVLIGENDCGITSMLDALELVLGFDDRQRTYQPWLFHQDPKTGNPAGPIRIRLRFAERSEGEWEAQEAGPLGPLLTTQRKRLRHIWYEIAIRPDGDGESQARYLLRAPGSRIKLTEPEVIGRFRRMNPVVRVAAGMLTGHGNHRIGPLEGRSRDLKVSPQIRELMGRINRAVESRISGRSLSLRKDLDDGIEAASRLIQLRKVKLGKWDSGLTRSVKEILGWQPGRDRLASPESFHDPKSESEGLGILLLIGALLRAMPGGMAPDADPLWIIEEPEAHLHPITLTSVAELVGLIQRQRVVTTYSGSLLSAVPLGQVRRLVRHDGRLHQRRVHAHTLSRSELRRFHYHLRTRFGLSLPQLARLMGYDLALEGIACIEFAQCGLDPPIKVATDLGIEWHVLADGDQAGQTYANAARSYIDGTDPEERLTLLAEKDIERHFWVHGYDEIYKKHARLKGSQLERLPPGKVIQAAVKKRSKPFLALSVVEAIATTDSQGIPPRLSRMIETCVGLARKAPSRLADS
jgi:putative ATP-dependent endonuclease of OLD family